jgi:hypothetical protein
MKTIRHLLLFGLLLSAFGLVCHAATRVVAPGTTIQAAINASATGDLIVVLPGTYDEDLVINGKGLTIRGQNQLSQVRSIQILNAPAPCKFTYLRTLHDVNATSSSVTLTKSSVTGSVNAVESSLRMIKCDVDGNVTVADSTNDANQELEAVILQSTIWEKLTCKAKRSWICYNVIRHCYLEGEVEVTGNDFNGRGLYSIPEQQFPGIGIDVNGAATVARIRNNQVRNYETSTDANLNEQCIGIRINGGAKADIVNNLIYDCFDLSQVGDETNCGMGIFVQSTTGTKILGNAIWSCFVHGFSSNLNGDRLVWAPKANVTLQYNNLFHNNHVDEALVGGGVVNLDAINADPKLIGGNPYDNNLQSDSPCIDKGPPDAQYNDLDGSRNDIGMHGGHGYLPDGRTTDKPIVLGIKADPIFVPAGGIITIQSTGAAPK